MQQIEFCEEHEKMGRCLRVLERIIGEVRGRMVSVCV